MAQSYFASVILFEIYETCASSNALHLLKSRATLDK